MKQFAIIGLGSFGLRMLDELLDITDEIIIIDKDREIVEKYKDKAQASYITDAINEQALKKIIPEKIDAVIVDLGGKVEVSIMTTNHLKKMGVREIIVKAQSDEHGEILRMVGATSVVFPDLEAAKRITPLLASSLLFKYLPISEHFAFAEVAANASVIGKSLLEANIRKEFCLNVVAIRKRDSEDIQFTSDPTYIFTEDDVLLVAGNDESIAAFSKEQVGVEKRKGLSFFHDLFKQAKTNE